MIHNWNPFNEDMAQTYDTPGDHNKDIEVNYVFWLIKGNDEEGRQHQQMETCCGPPARYVALFGQG